MSTRALYTFEGDNSEYHVYKHHDGYPTGALGFIRDALAKAWPLPRFEANEFAAAFVAANKNSPGGVRLTTGKTWGDAASGDIEYHYVITCRAGHLHIAIYHANCWEKPTQSLLASGTLEAMEHWATGREAAE